MVMGGLGLLTGQRGRVNAPGALELL
jgi:hypothetical protein